MDTNRFDLVRRYDHSSIKQLLSLAHELTGNHSTDCLRVVAFGSEDGYILDEALKLLGDAPIFIGIEGGKLLNENSPNWVNLVRHKKHIQGMDDECMFADVLHPQSKHPINEFGVDHITIAHIYDGGLLPKQTIHEIAQISKKFALGSIMIFVTNADDTLDFGAKKKADCKHIKRRMKSSGAWRLVKKRPIAEIKGGSLTMVALFYLKTK